MRLLICAGGTGGSVYPALSVLQTLTQTTEGARQGMSGQASSSEAILSTLWVGGIGGIEADLVKREGVQYAEIPAAQVHGISPLRLPGNLWQLGRGFFASLKLLRQFRPDALLFTGGFLAVPMALAARVSRIGKSLLYVPDIEPGWALKALARIADQIAVSVGISRAYFSNPAAIQVTGYPLRPGLKGWDAGQARAHFKLSQEIPVLLVMGGSKGARSINQALVKALPVLLDGIQVIHITGQLDWNSIEQGRENLSAEQAARYRAYPYLHEEIGAAMAAADLAISRAGASTLGEYPAFGLPAILVPYPFAWRYQKVNADYLVQHGAAVVVEDANLAEQLIPLVRKLTGDRPALSRMAQAMRSLAQPQAAASLAEMLRQMAAAASAARH